MELVKRHEPITGEQIAEQLGVSRPTLRSDLAVLVMLGMIDAKPKVGYFLGTSMHSLGQSWKQLLDLQVKDVKGVPMIVRETATVQDAVITLFLENVGSLVVVEEDGSFAGIVTRKDLLKVTLGNANAGSIPVSLVMTRYPNVVTAHPDDRVISAAEKMIKHEVDGLPVVVPTPEGKLEVVGRITKTTMTRILLEFLQ